jgi:hypothetical protein
MPNKIVTRVALAGFIVTIFWYAYEALQTHSFEVAPAAVIFYFVVYSFLISVLYAISSITRAPALVLIILFVFLHGALFYFGYTAYGTYELGGKVIVVDGRLTALGWHMIVSYIAVATLCGVVTAIVLFGKTGQRKMP